MGLLFVFQAMASQGYAKELNLYVWVFVLGLIVPLTYYTYTYFLYKAYSAAVDNLSSTNSLTRANARIFTNAMA